MMRAGLLQDTALFTPFMRDRRVALITDEIVAPLYGHALAERLGATLFSFPAGEQHKTRATKERLEDQMLAAGFGRDTVIIALGGGVVTDLAGFVAATYCRGVPLIMVPTTLMGMVDASLGGKTAVNTPLGKNMIGAFYQPVAIFIDPTTLSTLPQSEFKNGVVEMIKHGLVMDKEYFAFLETFQSAQLDYAIAESRRLKQLLVVQDEREGALRHLLNFGHTVGHALETVTNYTVSHGQAVAFGLIVESSIAYLMGYLPKESLDRLTALLQPYIPSTRANHNALLSAMARDKKALQGRPRIVLLDDIGAARGCFPVDEALIREALCSLL